MDKFKFVTDDYFCTLLDKVEKYIHESGLIARHLLLNQNLLYINIDDNNYTFKFEYNIDDDRYCLLLDALFCTSNKIYFIPDKINTVFIDNCKSLVKYYNDLGLKSPDEPRYFCSFVGDGNRSLGEGELYFYESTTELCNMDLDHDILSFDGFIIYMNRNHIRYPYTLNKIPLYTRHPLRVFSDYYKALSSLGLQFDYSNGRYAKNQLSILISCDNDIDILYDSIHVVNDYDILEIDYKYIYRNMDEFIDFISSLENWEEKEYNFLSNKKYHMELTINLNNALTKGKMYNFLASYKSKLKKDIPISLINGIEYSDYDREKVSYCTLQGG